MAEMGRNGRAGSRLGHLMKQTSSMRRGLNIWSRRLHRWGAIAALVPLTVVVVTGLMLQVRKQVAWVQPPEMKGAAARLDVSFDAVLAAVRAVPEAEVESWADVDRLDVRPGKGLIKVRCRNDWEVQVDAASGEVLAVAYRRSHIIEAIHEGALFGEWVQYGVFLPAGLAMLGLLGTGAYLWVVPIAARRRSARKTAERVGRRGGGPSASA